MISSPALQLLGAESLHLAAARLVDEEQEAVEALLRVVVELVLVLEFAREQCARVAGRFPLVDGAGVSPLARFCRKILLSVSSDFTLPGERSRRTRQCITSVFIQLHDVGEVGGQQQLEHGEERLEVAQHADGGVVQLDVSLRLLQRRAAREPAAREQRRKESAVEQAATKRVTDDDIAQRELHLLTGWRP